VYNHQDVPEVASLGLEAVKVGSGEARDLSLARSVQATAMRVIVALGLCENNPYQSAFCRDDWPNVQFLATATRYPAPIGLASQFISAKRIGWATTGPWHDISGWSDHAIGLSECQAAIVCGATLIEKHVQFPTQARPCQPWEATVDEFKQLRAFADEKPERFLGRWQAA
jgi:sialic acid synthase SpsE